MPVFVHVIRKESMAERAPRTVPKFMQVDPIGVDLSKVVFLRLQSIKHIHDERTAKIEGAVEEKVIALLFCTPRRHAYLFVRTMCL